MSHNISSENNGSPWVPNNERDKFQPIKRDIQTKPRHAPIITSKENNFLITSRNKIRISNPKLAYFYKEVPLSWLASVCHFISLTISLIILALGYLLFWANHQLNIPGIGMLNSFNPADITYLLITSIFLLYVIYRVYKIRIGARGYRLAIIANSVNLLVLHTLKAAILVLSILMIIYFVDIKLFHILVPELKNGAFADLLTVSLQLYSVVISIYCLRFCLKGEKK